MSSFIPIELLKKIGFVLAAVDPAVSSIEVVDAVAVIDLKFFRRRILSSDTISRSEIEREIESGR